MNLPPVLVPPALLAAPASPGEVPVGLVVVLLWAAASVGVSALLWWAGRRWPR